MKSLYNSFRASIAARLRMHFRDKEHSEDIAYAMVQMLKLPLQQARDLARAGATQRRQITKLPQVKNPGRALATLRSLSVPLDVAGTLRTVDAHAGNSYLLALPFSVSAMSLIAHLVRDTRRSFCVIDTQFTRYYFYPFLKATETRDRLQLLPPAAMLKHNRMRLEQPAAADNPVTYVTFPDLESTSLDTARRVRFMGEDYQFSTLEPLLFFRGLAPLFTFDAGDFAATRRLKLAAYESSSVSAVTEADVDALLAWLAKNMEQVFREAPADVLSWAETRMLAYGTKAITAVVKLKMVEGYVRAWKAADPNFKDATFARSIAELQKVQETIDKERLAASGS
ncbi:MAG TPA: hypothetical protein VKB02_10825 [Pyrinomonadaceae bacterium]|nr:hypothetical protein [Pyrinomonadaceae bacterium]